MKIELSTNTIIGIVFLLGAAIIVGRPIVVGGFELARLISRHFYRGWRMQLPGIVKGFGVFLLLAGIYMIFGHDLDPTCVRCIAEDEGTRTKETPFHSAGCVVKVLGIMVLGVATIGMLLSGACHEQRDWDKWLAEKEDSKIDG